MNATFNRIETMITPSMSIGVPVYVDDILGIGDRGQSKRLLRIQELWKRRKKSNSARRNQSI